jgi:DNA-binding response OmpR family regulator
LAIDPTAHAMSLAGKRLEMRRQEYELLLFLDVQANRECL